jgi:hypothetical protein
MRCVTTASAVGGLGLVWPSWRRLGHCAIADQMQEWLFEQSERRLPHMFSYLPQGLDDFVEYVVPELHRRGIFRREYERKTLRENLGLPLPSNRFFPPPAEQARGQA